MKKLAYLILAALFALPLSINAAPKKNVLIKVNGAMPVTLYTDAKGDKIARDLSASDMTSQLPLPVLNEQGEYAQVKLDGKTYWVHTEQFTVKRAVAIDCDKARISMSQGNIVQTGAPRGAAEADKLCGQKK